MPRVLTLALLVLSQTVLHAGDWPQWLGPHRDGSSDEKVAPWKGELKVLWKQRVGEGNSSAVIVKGKAYLHTLAKSGDKGKQKFEEQLTAFDAESGQVLWNTKYERPAATFLFGNGPRATPAVVDGKVYTFGITGLLTCFDAEKGALLWQVDTAKEFKPADLKFGISCSPLVVGNRILLNIGAKGASVVALDRNDGKLLWKSQDDSASYSSGIVVTRDKKEQAIFLTAKGLVSLSPEDGKLYWQYPLIDRLFESSTTPVMVGDMLFASSVTFGGLALQLENTPQGPGVKKLWMKSDLNCYFSTPIAVGKDQLYVVTPSSLLALKKTSTLRCVDPASGKELWNRPKVGEYHASLLRTGDSKLLLLEEKGELVLFDPDVKEFKELARSKICGKTWAHPALANGRFYIRDNANLICVQLN